MRRRCRGPSGNLVAAAQQSGVERFIAQSIAWVYAPGREPHPESDPLDVAAEGTRAVTVSGVVELERLVLSSAQLGGTVLRYGQLYGPDTGADRPSGVAAVQVDAAAWAALLATQASVDGVFNCAEPTGYLSIDRARWELGWDPSFRLATGQPARVPGD